MKKSRSSKNNVSDQIFEQLKDDIAHRVFAPGTKLPSENDLADSFGVGRISVRAAIQKLVAIGLAESRSGEGTFVKKTEASIYLNAIIPMLILEPKGIIELLEFRKGLEMQSCELAASRATAEEIDQLKKIIDHACTPNVAIQEQSLGIRYNKGNDLLDYLKESSVFKYEDGFIQIPEGPGLGIEIDEARVIEASKEGHNWKNPFWRNYDGTVAEW